MYWSLNKYQFTAIVYLVANLLSPSVDPWTIRPKDVLIDEAKPGDRQESGWLLRAELPERGCWGALLGFARAPLRAL